MTVITTSFEQTYTAAPPVLMQQRDIVVFIVTMACVGFFVVMFMYLLRQDIKELRVARKTKLSDKKMVRTAEDFFEGLIPNEFRQGKWYENLWGAYQGGAHVAFPVSALSR